MTNPYNHTRNPLREDLASSANASTSCAHGQAFREASESMARAKLDPAGSEAKAVCEKLAEQGKLGNLVISDSASSETLVKRSFETNADGSALYTVRSGDCVWNVAAEVMKHRLGRDVTKAEVLNMTHKISKASGLTSNGRNPDLIFPGEKLIIPKDSNTKPEATGLPHGEPHAPAARLLPNPKESQREANPNVSRHSQPERAENFTSAKARYSIDPQTSAKFDQRNQILRNQSYRNENQSIPTYPAHRARYGVAPSAAGIILQRDQNLRDETSYLDRQIQEQQQQINEQGRQSSNDNLRWKAKNQKSWDAPLDFDPTGKKVKESVGDYLQQRYSWEPKTSSPRRRIEE
jgi:hypothetical protein